MWCNLQVSKHHSSSYSPVFFSLHRKWAKPSQFTSLFSLWRGWIRLCHAKFLSVGKTRSFAAQRRAMRDKPYQLPNLFHHEVGVARSAHLVYYAYISSPQCQLQWRHALLKVGPKMAVSFQVLSTGVCLCLHCSHPHPAKSKPRLVGLQLLWQTGWGKVTLLCIRLWLF